jgi:hypothetical protein
MNRRDNAVDKSLHEISGMAHMYEYHPLLWNDDGSFVVLSYRMIYARVRLSAPMVTLQYQTIWKWIMWEKWKVWS